MFLGHFKTFSVARRCRDNLLKTSKIFKANSFQLCTLFWVNFATMFILKQNTIYIPIAILSLVTYESLLSNSHINPRFSSSLNPRTVLLVDALGEKLH